MLGLLPRAAAQEPREEGTRPFCWSRKCRAHWEQSQHALVVTQAPQRKEPGRDGEPKSLSQSRPGERHLAACGSHSYWRPQTLMAQLPVCTPSEAAPTRVHSRLLLQRVQPHHEVAGDVAHLPSGEGLGFPPLHRPAGKTPPPSAPISSTHSWQGRGTVKTTPPRLHLHPSQTGPKISSRPRQASNCCPITAAKQRLLAQPFLLWLPECERRTGKEGKRKCGGEEGQAGISSTFQPTPALPLPRPFFLSPGSGRRWEGAGGRRLELSCLAGPSAVVLCRKADFVTTQSIRFIH